MKETITIVVNNSKGDKIGPQFNVLANILSQIPSDYEKFDYIFDLSNTTFIYPLIITSLAALKQSFEGRNCNVEIINPHADSSLYLNYTHFKKPLDCLNTQDWQKELDQYKSKSYLPICLIPTGNSNASVREGLHSIYTEIMQVQLKLPINIKIAITFIISEFIDNVDQHSNAPFGYIMVQHYRTKGFLQLCIIDRGDGILKTYTRNGFSNIKTHTKSLEEALKGLSTKTNEKERGYGIRTSRKMLVQGLGGEFFLMTGNALFVYTNEFEQIIELDVKQAWNGTILAINIPMVAPQGFNYVDYLES